MGEHRKKFWTEEKIAQVRELATKMSAAMIANEVGAPSRQAVIGIAYRAGIRLTGSHINHLPRGGNNQHTVRAAREPTSAASRDAKNLQRADRIVKTAQDIQRNAEWLQKPPEPIKTWDGFVSLFDLMNHHCRSIEGYEGSIAFFCGRPKAHGTSWCDHHARRFVPGLFEHTSRSGLTGGRS